jgi:hypothetical protein
LSGAYSLARSTLGQMGVRIALQCSESDAHLILSEDNGAARLLSRPGEAIYNDANGLVEGNHVFQVVWLPDERREVYLQRIADLARIRGLTPTKPPVIFEGNVPADVTRNPLLETLLSATEWPPGVRSAKAWLGEAVAIKDPSAANFRPQGGSNLLIVGQNEEAALAMAMVAAVSLAAQHDPSGAKFYLGDGTPVDSPRLGLLGRVADSLPHPCRAFGARELPDVMTELVEEVERRQGIEGTAGPAIYLILHDLARFRDLRRQEDDFSFGRTGEDKPANPAKQLSTVLRDGPPVGVHVWCWCDTLSNVNRALERQDLREFEMRVLFQMSQADSSNLIDSPIASKLGWHRAFFHSEEEGTLEKFRPYGRPTDEWLDQVRARLNGRPAAAITRAGDEASD